MFEESVSEQLHQFISSRTSLPLPLSFSPNPNFSTFDSHTNTSHLQPTVFQASNLCKNGGKDEESFVDQRQTSWSSEEVVSLLGIRSNMECWFPDFTWEHVSRKLTEMGFEKSPEKCKEKFEEEIRYFDAINGCKSYRFLSDLEEELYHHENNPQIDQNKKKSENPRKITDHGEEIMEGPKIEEFLKNKRRKKDRKLEVFRVYCEDIVKAMMMKQEEMHNKVLEEMVKRDAEKIAKEEAWKREEMEKMNKELEIMAQEQAMAGDRQALILSFLKKFAENPTEIQSEKPKTSSSSLAQPQNPKNNQTLSLSKADPLVQNPNNSASLKNTNSSKKEPDLGKRWPKDEVLALINLRCIPYNNGGGKESSKATLWERVSHGMMEMGYLRNSKRCKEKWENINKYFRKTREINKKRPLDSRTCPYFHHLSNLYRHGRSIQAPNFSENLGERNTASDPAFDFEF